MTEMVRAAVQTGTRKYEVQSFPRPKTGPEDGLLRVEASGICGSDVEMYKGTLGGGGGRRGGPFIPGHEPLGIIEEVGEKAAERWGVKPGDRVALEILRPCRNCDHCLTGRYMSCPNRDGAYGVTPTSVEPALWGGHAEYLYLHPRSIVHKVRNDIPADTAVMFNPLGAGVRWACHLGGVELGSSVLVLGPGQRGLAAVIAAKAAGASNIIVTGLSRDQPKLDLAREFGADHTVNVDTEDTVEKVRDLTGGQGVDVAMDLTPMAVQPIRDAIGAVRPFGRVVLAGLKGQRNVELVTDQIINKGLTVVGAYSVDARGYNEAIRIIESGRYPLEKMHTHTFGLDDAAHAVELLAGEVEGQDAIHVVINPALGS